MMKLLPNIKERLRRTYFSMGNFYAIFLTFTVLIPVFTNFITSNNSVSTSVDPSIPSFFYGIAIGIVLVTSGFNSSIQFGTSRKTIFVAYIITTVIISISMIVINLFLSIGIRQISWIKNIEVTSAAFHLSQYSLGVLVFDFVLIMIGFSFGILIGLIIKRVKKEYLLIIGTILMFTPALVSYIVERLSHDVQQQLLTFISVITGAENRNIWALITMILVITIMLHLGSWLIIRRQPVK
ncbi:hypothetical protein RD055328_11090 [Companilactobacillus sp. RD055328]|uniref:hypothetical protein n=1 Tax=Companilactobacillus sp. RD055328 TaxID=2916634 RepID=UPI001FC89BC6|nr:hypothetical protein [Companilactobacillus sp. RD055328]GKQ43186.1 hypothetical protein RD055328_11090 [Companilactobacillus sp. RD055328]